MSNSMVQWRDSEMTVADSALNEVGTQILDLYFPGGERPPLAVAKAAAYLALTLGLSPAQGEIYIASFGSKKVGDKWEKDWRAIIGVRGYRRNARRISNYTMETRVMGEEEVKAQRGANFDERDVGVEVTLWRFDVAKEAKSLGIPYHPTKAMGFWRAKARFKQDKWEPDNIPESWNPQMVAEKRAELNALKLAYDLDIPRTIGNVPVGGADAVDDEMVIEGMAKVVERYGPKALEMEDWQMEKAVQFVEAEDAMIEKAKSRTPEERKAAGDKAKQEMTGRKKRRLGDEPAPESDYDPIAFAMKFGVFPDRDSAIQTFDLVVEKAEARGEDTKVAWEGYVSRLIDRKNDGKDKETS